MVKQFPYYITLDYRSALRTAKHCIAMVTWAWSPAQTLGLVPGGGACVWGLGEPGLAPGLWPWIGLGWALTWFAQAGACAGLHLLGLLATGYPNPSTRKFWTVRFWGLTSSYGPRDFQLFRQEVSKGFVGGCARACGHEDFPLFRQKVSRGFVSEVCWGLPDTWDVQPCCKRATKRILLEASRGLGATMFSNTSVRKLRSSFFKNPRAFAATRFAKPSVRMFRKGSFLKPPDMRAPGQWFPTLP